MTEMREALVQDYGDYSTTGRGKNGYDTLLTTRNLLFLIILIQILTFGYVMFKPQKYSFEEYRKTITKDLDTLKSDVYRNGEGIQDIKRMNKENVTTILSALAALKLDVEQIKMLVNSNAPNSATPARQLILAALNEPHTGDMKGWGFIDPLCREQAQAAGFNGTFESFLGGEAHRIYDNVPPELRNLSIVNTKGEKLFSSWNSLFSGDEGIFPSSTKLYSFDGRNVLTNSHWPDNIVWHGALPNGNTSNGLSCERWKSSSSNSLGLASTWNRHKLLSQETFLCSRRFIVLCIQDSIPEPIT